MSNSKPKSIEPFAELVFKATERMLIVAVLGFAAAHLEGPAEWVGATIAAALLLLAMVALIDPLLAKAAWRDGKLSGLLRSVAALLLALSATFIFMFGFLMVLPFSG